MINFDFLTLEKFLNENSDFLTGARIQKIQHPTRKDFIFTLRNYSETRKLYVNINPQFFHICFLNENNEKKRYLGIPQKPPMFCMLLRKYLESSKISKVLQPKNERILEFYFKTFNETEEEIYLCLAIELMGKHSNIVLYNYDTNVIIGCAHNIGEDKSKVRELYGGLAYTYPPKALNKNFNSLSENFDKNKTINSQIDEYFGNLQETDLIKTLKIKLCSVTNNHLKKIKKTLEKMEKQKKSDEKLDLYKNYGNLIMANLFSNKDFSSKINVTDFETNLPITIELDNTKTLKQNANKFFSLYNKGKIAKEKTSEIVKKLKFQLEYLEQILYSIEVSDDIKTLKEIENEICQTKEKIKTKEKINIKTIIEAPYKIYIGKNNKQNDYIVSKLAKKDDLWFHIHNCAGSHILLKAEAGNKFSDEIIFECAKLAKQYSSAKNSSKVGIIYTKAQNLKKPPAANLGYVIYKNEEEIIVD